MASLLENENNQSIADRTRSKTPCTEQHSENHYTNGLIKNVSDSESDSESAPNVVWCGSKTKQLGSRQDFTITGWSRYFTWLVVCDGHGKGKVLNILSKFEWGYYIEKYEDDIDKLIEELKTILSKTNNFRDGSTCSIVKIYEDKIVAHTIGDSMVAIKINDKYYYTKNHDANNHDEIERITHMGSRISDTWKSDILGETKLTMKVGKYFHFINPLNENISDTLAMTRSLGHNIYTQFPILNKFDTLTINTNKSDKIIIIAATDGLWDVVYNPEKILDDFEKDGYDSTALDRLMNRTEEKWCQTWDYVFEGNSSKNKFPNPDDIGISVYTSF